MRWIMLVTLSVTLVSLAAVPSARAVTITNLDADNARIFVCDEQCGPSHGDDWGSARDFWLAPGETRSFDCAGKCFVGLYDGDNSPSLGDMAMSDDDEVFMGDEVGYIQKGYATHTRK